MAIKVRARTRPRSPRAQSRSPRTEHRGPLTRERVLRAAVALADKDGIDSLSMRKLGDALGVEAMSLYNHVKHKEDLLDGIVDVLVGEIPLPRADAEWKPSLRGTVLGARKVLLRHTWVPRVIESRKSPSPATIRYFDAVLGILRRGGFSLDAAHHALHIMGSRVLGFTQELFNDSDEFVQGPEAAAVMAQQMASTYPYITEMAMAVSHGEGLGGCDDNVEFEIALDLILDGLDGLRDAAALRA
jgi:AcrR family transcriptional regulator